VSEQERKALDDMKKLDSPEVRNIVATMARKGHARAMTESAGALLLGLAKTHVPEAQAACS